MKLYHWTPEKNLLGIACDGLKPFCYDDGAAATSAGREVVWLTASKTRTQTAAGIEWLKSRPDIFDAEAVENFSKLTFGDPDDVRLTIKFNSSNNQRLKKYLPWVRQFGAVTATGERVQLGTGSLLWPSAANYFVHLGVIPARQIELPPITARIALLGLKHDAPQVEQLRSLPPDTVMEIPRGREAA